MDTRASDHNTILSGPELLSLVEKIKKGPRGPTSTVDELATEYHDQLSQLHTQGMPGDISNPSALTTVFQSFLGEMDQLHSELSSRAMAEHSHTVEEQIQCSRQVDRAWDALIRGQCLGLGTTPLTSWLEEWVFTTIGGLMHLARRTPMVTVCVENGLDRHVADRLALFSHRGIAVLGAATPTLLPRASSPVDDDDAYGSVADRRRCKFYAHIARDSYSACGYVNGCAAACQKLVHLRVLRHAQSYILAAIRRAAGALADVHSGQWADACLEDTVNGVRLATATFEALLVSTDHSDTFSLADYAERCVFQRFAELRTTELFAIIIDYPDSRGAIDDLRTCVARLRSLRQVALALRSAVQRRLLHPGATTGDILTQYISAIRCLRLLDPSSTVLEIVARPIRSYLRARPDTVACIVQDMVSEESELFEDLAGHGAHQLIIDNDPDGIVYDEEYADTQWEPLPVAAKTVYRSAQRRDADVLSLLVSIYDSKDVFVREFESYLERQLLEQRADESSVDREIKQVEMMKLRFGDTAMVRCEVMLKDISDSRRIALNVAEASQAGRWPMPLHATVVSRQFWSPSTQTERFAMPAPMAELIDRYAHVFCQLKPARTLEWRPAQGHVVLDIELADRSLELTVKPAQAAVLFAFQEHSGPLALDELAERLETTEDFILPRVRFWQARGVVRETAPNTFVVAETEETSSDLDAEPLAGTKQSRDDTASATGPKQAARMDDDEEEEEESQDTSASTARTETLRMNFKYIVGMLTNLGPLPLDRIISMLSMFVPGESTTTEEMRDFLAQMVREDKLEMFGGMYKLKQ